VFRGSAGVVVSYAVSGILQPFRRVP